MKASGLSAVALRELIREHLCSRTSRNEADLRGFCPSFRSCPPLPVALVPPGPTAARERVPLAVKRGPAAALIAAGLKAVTPGTASSLLLPKPKLPHP